MTIGVMQIADRPGGWLSRMQEVRFHYFCMDLPHSDDRFVKAYPTETAGAFCDGHVAGVDFSGGVPQSILYDKTRLAVAKIVNGVSNRIHQNSRRALAG